MKKTLFQITSIALALIVVMSSMSFTIDKHYCGETLVDVSYFGKADNCDGMEMNSSSQQMKKKCCKNETEFIQSEAFEKENILTLNPEQLEFLVFHLYSYINLYQDVELEKEFYKDFSPPDIVEDIQVLHESFLI